MQVILINLIKFYQFFISPLIGDVCRFYPSCSEYSKQAILKHGVLRGLALCCWRLLRCQPLCKGGYDPVPKCK